MDALDFDDIERALSVVDHLYHLHFIGSLAEARNALCDEEFCDEEFCIHATEPSDICFTLTTALFTDTLIWVEARQQDFADPDFPKVVLVDPENVLLDGGHSYALSVADYELLMDTQERAGRPRITTNW
jgi:hypothetical protein